ncbi:MAG: hypothetical protein JKX86_02320 [Verrucomicrobiales bacterium]|jgi:predicted  nucleic acid-binding Zn-ribbon protein|nr:hypothetical protein [Verrucomicrobiales bacterium]
MDSGKLMELAIIAIILAGIGYVIWRGGAANPVGTGHLQQRFRSFSTDLATMSSGMETLGDQIKALEQSGASAHEVKRLQGEFEAEKARTDKIYATLERIDGDVKGMREDQAARNQVIASLSDSVRSVANSLEQHRRDITEKQSAVAETCAATSSDLKLIGRQLDRLYDVIVKKGLAK